MTPEQFAAQMRELYPHKDYDLTEGFDQEKAHVLADELLARCLREAGYGDGVEVYEGIPKWYA